MVGPPPTKMVINHIGCPSSYRDNGLSATLVVLSPTQTIVYQPQWLILLHRQWFIKHTVLHRQLFINHNGWSSSYTDDGFINHTVCSSSYKDTGLSNTLVGPPLTQTIVYQPQWLVFLLHRQWFINHTVLHRQLFINHNGWSSSYTDCGLSTTLSYTGNCLSTTMAGLPPIQTMVLSTTLFVPPPTKSMVYQPHWLVLLLHIQRLINHTDPSSSCIGKT